MLDHYTNTQKIKITVLDENKNPIPNAVVKFKLYNYAEYYPIATQNTNEKGVAQVTTGLGDLLIWASKDGRYNYQKLDVRLQNELTLILTKEQGEPYVETFDIFPPIEKKVVKEIDPSVKDKHAQRLLYEDSIRNSYTATFMSEEEAKTVKNANLTTDQIVRPIKRS